MYIIKQKKKKNHGNQTSDNTTDSIKIEDVEKVEINVDSQESSEKEATKRTTHSNVIQIKKYLSEHYEIDRSIINVQIK